MLDFDYKDKYKLYLSQYDLDVELFMNFGVEVSDIYPVRKVFLVSTDKGKKILKKIDYTIDEFNFINNALEYIYTNYNRIMKFCKNNEGKNYVIWSGDAYCLIDMVPGRECRYSNPLDLSIAARELGNLHKASEGFKSSLKSKDIRGNLIERFKRNLDEMKFFKMICNMYDEKSEFDDIFIQNVDYYIKQIKKSIEILEKTQYFKLSSEEDKIAICHHDLAERNIMIDNEKAYFIDFDYAIVDLKVHDLCNFINKVVKIFDFDIEKAKIIIENYCTTNTISNKEFEVLYAMLTFPQDFYSICKKYYTKRENWDENTFLYRLKKKVSNRYDREEFLDKIKNLKI